MFKIAKQLEKENICSLLVLYLSTPKAATEKEKEKQNERKRKTETAN